MKTIIEYQCEVCNRTYKDKTRALNCEKRGKGIEYVKNRDQYIGIVYEYHHNGYVGIFAIAEVQEFDGNKHLATYANWACRVTGYGDSLDHLCGNSSFLSDFLNAQERGLYKLTKAKLKSKECKRMLKHLKSKGIIPKYRNEKGELITLNEKSK